jgi:cold shock CspA family protein
MIICNNHILSKYIKDKLIIKCKMTEVGKVNWFDKSKGYGFIRIISDTSNKEKDVFVHYTGITSDVPYKKLYPGECVSLEVLVNEEAEESKRFSATNVTGLFGTQLLCESDDYVYKVIRKRPKSE